MLVAVTSTGPGRLSEVDKDFGRARYILFVDLASGDLETVDNQDNMKADQEAGIRAAKEVIDRNAEWVLTGHIGDKAFQELIGAGISIGTGASGTIRDALKQVDLGDFESSEEPLPCKDQNGADAKTDLESRPEEPGDSQDNGEETTLFQTGETSFIAYRPQVPPKRSTTDMNK